MAFVPSGPLAEVIALHQQGQLEQARQGYEAILATDPSSAAALHYLGLLEHQCGNTSAALQHLRRAAQSEGAQPFYWVNLGNLLKDLQRPQEAEEAYQRALAQEPGDALALYNLGHLYQLYGRWSDAAATFAQAVGAQNDFVPAWQKLAAMELRSNRREQALAAAEQAVALAPGDAPGWFHLADALGRFGRWTDSKQALERCLALQPQFPEAWNNLGLARKNQGDLDGAMAAFEAALQQAPPSDPGNASMAAETCANLAQFELDAYHLEAAQQWSARALALDPGNAQVQFTQGNVLNALGQYEPAATALRLALELQPDFPEALNNLGNILLNLRRHSESIAIFERAIAQRTDYAEALANLANAQREASYPDLAEQALQEAIRIRPDFAAAHSNLGNAYFDQGKVDLALASYRRGIELGQDDRDFVPNYLFALNYSPSASDADLAAETRRLCQAKFDDLRSDPVARDPAARRLRVGYVSPDLWMHPVARFLLPVLEHHDRSRFEVFAYSSRYLKDGMTTEIAKRVEQWREVHQLNDAALADLIRADGIDLLVDLTMYARDCRPGLFARKPAPVQITYLAYVGTTGLAAMDYRITDGVLDPPEGSPLPFSEQPLRLPRCWWSFAVPPPVVSIPLVAPPPCLSSGVISFGSLNNFVKVNEGVRELWAQLVASVPGSRLVLHIKETRARQGLLEFFAERGVASDRISLIGYQNGPDYMATYGQIDIALDTAPFAGGTTSFDALWMGVPLVTLAGERSSSRGGASILTSLGRPEWIARSPEEYIAIAQRLAADPQQLAAIRSGLRAELQASPLMDCAGFTRELEDLYRQAWERGSRRGAASGAGH
ncbi:MAG: tetratricopeptide repeat protein [Vulcanococcus sp.]|jgi:predicted O-linked N-acetylglucosamine transferase (SPINDLY family)|uniref:tetratricopeptide repeat protein n=1 Tax=Vulcanococcus sp. TaxID=2856995 RepID=UPI0025FA96FB|nr:tetratricopeptide repeat protein [Vulcanococcus sp.]MBW0173034.1 tetratricopeptide repeat protein [Vulcanococcus sp.]MBW0179928.1 tetratricopeptide repeat protein [Vulcanococcus sp.]